MQFDQRAGSQYRRRSCLYWTVLPHGYICIDVYSPTVSVIDCGCIIYVLLENAAKARFASGQVLVYGDNFRPALEAFEQAIAAIPPGFRMATEDDPPRLNKSGIDDRQLIMFGRYLKELRTGSPF